MADVIPDPIMRIATGFMASKYLFVASTIGLFEALASGPATLDELAAKCNVPRRTLGINIDSLVSLSLIEHDGGHYRNCPVAATFLAGGTGPDWRPLLRMWDHISYGLWANFEGAVRAGEGHGQFHQFTEEQQQIFSAAVETFTAGMAAVLAANYDFGRHRRVLDVGGGTGSFLIAILRKHPALQGTLFELPGACVVARQQLAGVPEGPRVTVVEGDFLKDPLPGGHDALIVANVVHVLSAAHNLELLKSMRAQASPGTKLLLVDLWMDAMHKKPWAGPLMSGEFLLISGEGQAYDENEAHEWLTQTDWHLLERRSLTGPASVIIAEAI